MGGVGASAPGALVDHPNGRGTGERVPGLLSPWWILVVFGLAAGAGIGGVPARVTAAVLVLMFAVAVSRHPGNGLAALVLASAFLLGEQKTPYFPLQHAAVMGVLLGFVVHSARRRLPVVPFYWGAVLFFVASAVVSLPLNLRDLLEDLRLFRALDWSRIFVEGIPDISHLKYLDRVGVLALAAAIFVAASQPHMAVGVLGALRPLAMLTGLMAAFGLLRFFGVIQTTGRYLTLSFGTWRNPDLRLTAVAWNPDYFAQFLVLVVPIMVALLWAEASRWRRAGAGVAALLAMLALVFTFQRAAYAAILVALGALAILLWRTVGRTRPGAGAQMGVLVAAGLLFMLVAAAALDTVVLHGRVVERLGRFAQDPNRLRLWETALRMVGDQPLLGVGTGRYAFFFHEYAGELRRGFGPFWGTAHGTYLHVAAEQGLVGLASLLVLFGGVWLGAVRRLPRLRGTSAVLLSGFLAALAGWFAYGVVQYTFRVDALVYLVCILAGVTVALVPPDRRTGVSRRWGLVAAALALVVLGLRADVALRRPVSLGYEVGFYRWERQADGRAVRWSRGRAAMSIPVRGRIMELQLRAPIPGVETRPQVVQVWVDRRLAAEVRLANPEWHAVDLPVEAPAGGRVLVELDVAYTFVPSRLTGSRDERRLGVMMAEVAWRESG